LAILHMVGPCLGGRRKGDAKEASLYLSSFGPGVPQKEWPRSWFTYGYFLSNIIRWKRRKLSKYYIWYSMWYSSLYHEVEQWQLLISEHNSLSSCPVPPKTKHVCWPTSTTFEPSDTPRMI